MMNNINLIGRTTKEIELRYIPNTGTAVATLTVAVDRDYKDKSGNTPTDFIPVEIMGKSAEYAANYIEKGYLVAVTGSLRVDKYTDKDGNNRTFTKVFANNIQNLQYRQGGTEKTVMATNTGTEANKNKVVKPNTVEFQEAIEEIELPF